MTQPLGQTQQDLSSQILLQGLGQYKSVYQVEGRTFGLPCQRSFLSFLSWRTEISSGKEGRRKSQRDSASWGPWHPYTVCSRLGNEAGAAAHIPKAHVMIWQLGKRYCNLSKKHKMTVIQPCWVCSRVECPVPVQSHSVNISVPIRAQSHRERTRRGEGFLLVCMHSLRMNQDPFYLWPMCPYVFIFEEKVMILKCTPLEPLFLKDVVLESCPRRLVQPCCWTSDMLHRLHPDLWQQVTLSAHSLSQRECWR